VSFTKLLQLIMEDNIMTLTKKITVAIMVTLLALATAGASDIGTELEEIANEATVKINSSFHSDASETISFNERTSQPHTVMASSYRSSKNMIKAGKTLTFLGIGGLVGGAAVTAVGAGMALEAMLVSGFLSDIAYISEWAAAWTTVMSSLATVSAETLELITTSIVLFAVGGSLLVLSMAIIPGIIIWVIGARGSSSRKESKLYQLDDEVGFGIRL
jgi:hypothetical protein